MTDWKNKRPGIVENVSALGIGKAIYAAPDGEKQTARLLVAADGFHFKNSDFDDLKLLSLSMLSPTGNTFSISFDDNGDLLVNGKVYATPTNQSDETIKGNKTYEGNTRLSGRLIINSSGYNYEISVDENGNVKATKISETLGENDGKTKNQ
ncbi:hypothetical protein [Leuconostoc mesenteroides]|uniref:hypothetical protein n=1 Tax=Leuconostoc mesenteroides TaxID=1245 RepID=UPI0009FC81AE|nr:hypothetical protein [Leuconostoc mesenteroides]ORI79586.1 hypothetical protein BMS92_07730 [Leuconostoc mesenteroides subsp. mesenteroides]